MTKKKKQETQPVPDMTTHNIVSQWVHDQLKAQGVESTSTNPTVKDQIQIPKQKPLASCQLVRG